MTTNEESITIQNHHYNCSMSSKLFLSLSRRKRRRKPTRPMLWLTNERNYSHEHCRTPDWLEVIAKTSPTMEQTPRSGCPPSVAYTKLSVSPFEHQNSSKKSIHNQGRNMKSNCHKIHCLLPIAMIILVSSMIFGCQSQVLYQGNGLALKSGPFRQPAQLQHQNTGKLRELVWFGFN